jgi:hypothetical protein
MRVENLLIERPSYPDNSPLQGQVQMSGLNGKMEVKLAPQTIAAIFSLVRSDVEKTAEYNARQSGEAIDNAEGECKLLEVNE